MEEKEALGELEAIVMPDIQDNLVSFADFAYRGSTIMLTADGGAMTNSFNETVLIKDFGTWRLRLADIVDYNHKHDSHLAFAASISKTKLGRYIVLQERSCRQSPEVLIRALEGDSPSWIRANITAQEIREVASKYTCVTCVLAKRRAKSIVSNLRDPVDSLVVLIRRMPCLGRFFPLILFVRSLPNPSAASHLCSSCTILAVHWFLF